MTLGSLADASGSPTGHQVLLGANTLDTGADNSSTTFSGTISGNAGSLIKDGTGTLALTGVNTYTGTTTVRGGTLLATNAAALPGYLSSGNVSVSGGAGVSVRTGDGTTGWSSAQISSLLANTTWNNNTSTLGIDTTNGDVTYGSNVTQGLSLVKLGASTLTLTGSNSYTGGTTVSAGTLNLAQPFAVQNSTVNVSSSGALSFAGGNTNPVLGGLAGEGNIALATVIAQPVTLNVGNNGQNTTYGGILSGAGGLLKQGAGVLTLTASQSYSGPTIISGGTLRIPGVLRVPAGATAAYTFDNALGGNVPNAANPGTYDGTLQNGAAVTTFPGSPNGYALSLGAQGGGNDTYLQAAGSNNNGIPTSSGTYTASAWFYGLYGPGNWRTLFCGSPGGDNLVIINSGDNNLGFYGSVGGAGGGFNGSGYSMASYDGAATWNQLTVVASGGTSTYYVNGQEVGTVPKVSTAGIFAIGSSPGWYEVFSQYLDDVYIYNNTALNAADVMQLYCATSGEKQGANVLPVTTALSIAANSTLDLAGVSQQVASLAGSGSVINSNNRSASVLTVTPTSGSTAFSGIIRGGGTLGTISLVISGSGMQVLAGNNTYTGGTMVSGGTLQLGNNRALGVGGLTVSTSTLLDLNGFSPAIGALNGGGLIDNVAGGGVSLLTIGSGGSSGTFSGTIQNSSGTTALIKVGGGTQVLTGTNTYSGGTQINGGILAFSASALPLNSSTPNISFGGGTLQWVAGNTQDVSAGIAPVPAGQAAIIDTNGNNVAFASTLSGSGSLTKTGAGILALTTSNAYNGMTSIVGGTLNLAQPFAVQNSTVNVSSSGALSFAGGNTNPVLGGLAGEGNIALATVIAQPVTLNVGNNGQNTTYGGILSGAGGLLKQGAGVLTLTASQSYSGPTIISGGTLRIPGVLRVPAGATAAYTFDNALGGNVPNAANPGTYDGTLQNGAAVTTFPGSPNGYALSLGAQGGGNDTYLQAAGSNNNGIPTSSGTYTASAWFYGLYGPGNWRTLFCGSPGGDNLVIINSGDNNLGFYGSVGGAGGGFNGSGYSMASYDGAATWNQLTVVASGGTSTYYVNGQEVGTVPKVSTAGIFAIGSSPGWYEVFSQYLDDVYIYNNTALNAADVMQLYNATSGRQAANVLPTTTALFIAANSTLDLGGGSQQVASLAGSGSVINSNTGSASVLTVTLTGGSNAFSGMILGGGTLGTISLVISGSGTQVLAGSLLGPGSLTVNSGTLILSGSDSYTGGTDVVGGTLVVDSSTALPDGTSLTVGAGGTFMFDPSVASAEPIASAAASQINPVPEPGTLLLLSVGAAGLLVCAWRRRLASANG